MTRRPPRGAKASAKKGSPKLPPAESHRWAIEDGSLLVMQGDCQKEWYHEIPKEKKITTGRIVSVCRCRCSVLLFICVHFWLTDDHTVFFHSVDHIQTTRLRLIPMTVSTFATSVKQSLLTCTIYSIISFICSKCSQVSLAFSEVELLGKGRRGRRGEPVGATSRKLR